MNECEVCGYEFDVNLPGVDLSEAPFFTHKVTKDGDGEYTRYICSAVCMEQYIQNCRSTQPRGPNPPRY